MLSLPSRSKIFIQNCKLIWIYWIRLQNVTFYFSCQCFWTDWQKIFSNFCPITALSVCDQDGCWQNDMPCVFNSCQLEICSNGGLKGQHLKFPLQQQKILYLHYHKDYGHETWPDDDLPWVATAHKTTWLFDHVVLQITWQPKFVLTHYQVARTSKLGRMVAQP